MFSDEKRLRIIFVKRKKKKPAAYLPECTHNAQSFDCIFIFYDFINQRISILIYEMNSLFYVTTRSQWKEKSFLSWHQSVFFYIIHFCNTFLEINLLLLLSCVYISLCLADSFLGLPLWDCKKIEKVASGGWF